MASERPTRASLVDLAAVFLRLGLTSFGGPAAHLAIFRDELVRRRGWLAEADLLDLIGAANLIPGPNSTEVAIHVGYRRAGWPGLFVAGIAFILPAFAIVLALAWIYVATEGRPGFTAVFAGIAPVVVAIIAHAGAGLVRTAARTRLLAAIVTGSVLAALAGVGEIPILVAGGAIVLATHVLAGGRALKRDGFLGGLIPVLPAGLPDPVRTGAASALAAVAAGPTLIALFVSMFAIGAVLYGSGYVLITFLRAEFVEALGWITDQQLLDAVAIGQVTPGPLFTTATFVGFLVLGVPGAVVATVGIFLPAFAYVALSAPLLPRLRRSAKVRATLDGVNAAALGLVGAVAIELAWSTIRDPLSLGIALGSFVVLWRTGRSTAWLIAAGGALGLARLVLGA